MTQKPKPKRRLVLFSTTAGGVVFVCCLCLALGFLYNLTPSGMAAGTQRAVLSATTGATRLTPRPSDTARPSDTPRPPTNTPEPKPTTEPATAAPSLTPQATVSVETVIYAGAVAEQMTSLTKALGELGGLMSDPKLLDDDWKLNVAIQIAIIRYTYQKIESIIPPAEMASVHESLVAAIGDCNEATDYLVSGLDNFSVDDLNQASALIISCGEKMGAVGEALPTLAQPSEDDLRPTNTQVPPPTFTRAPQLTATLAPLFTATAENPTQPPVVATDTPVPAPAVCDCLSGDIYNCPDFGTHAAAQACFEFCLPVAGDIHRLDQDNDGIACENLPNLAGGLTRRSCSDKM